MDVPFFFFKPLQLESTKALSTLGRWMVNRPLAAALWHGDRV